MNEQYFGRFLGVRTGRFTTARSNIVQTENVRLQRLQDGAYESFRGELPTGHALAAATLLRGWSDCQHVDVFVDDRYVGMLTMRGNTPRLVSGSMIWDLSFVGPWVTTT